jgi:uncharacterized protein (DUF4415 family)
MNKNSSLKNSHTDHDRLNAMNDRDIDLSEIPEIREEQISESTIRFKGIPLSKKKIRINILLDETIVAYFKTLASGRGYQTLINEALKQSMIKDDLEKTLRRIIREELKAAG